MEPTRTPALVAARRGSPHAAFMYLRRSILFRIAKAQSLFSWLAEKRVIITGPREKRQEVKVEKHGER